MKPSTSLRLSLVVAAARTTNSLEIVLESIGLQKELPHEVIVVGGVVEKLTEAVTARWATFARCPVKYVPARGGISGSRAADFNEAIRASSGEYLIFIEDDCVPHRRFIADHLRHARRGMFVRGRRAHVRTRYVRRVSALRFKPVSWFLRRRIHGFRKGFRLPWPEVRLNDQRPIHPGNFAVWRSDLLRVNGFNELFDEEGYEITELANRLINAGVNSRTITGQAIVYHLEHPHVRRYGSNVSLRLLDQTRREKLTVCDHGLLLTTSSAADARSVPHEATRDSSTTETAPHISPARVANAA